MVGPDLINLYGVLLQLTAMNTIKSSEVARPSQLIHIAPLHFKMAQNLDLSDLSTFGAGGPNPQS